MKETKTITKKRAIEVSNHLSSAEDLLYFLSIIDRDDIKSFLEHYKEKENNVKAKDEKIDVLIRKSKSPEELIKELKNFIASALKLELKEITSSISAKRKKGVDFYFEDLKIIAIQTKIKMFQNTFDKQDFYKVKKLLLEVSESIKSKEIKKESEENLQQKIAESKEKLKTNNSEEKLNETKQEIKIEEEKAKK